MKSNEFSFQAQSCSMSSSSKRQFGGTLTIVNFLGFHVMDDGPYHSDCVGAISTPKT
jgi:hypothetical protein